jgi:hypothetical protein
MEHCVMGQEIILPDLVLSSRAHRHWQYSGIDSLEQCLDKRHFVNYPHRVEYVYNSRGFRDAEWPNTLAELRDAVWCLGDSFTVGVGQPFEHTWPQVLQKHTALKTINVSMDGASNQWIVRRARDILREIDPKRMIIMWSYTHRRESSNSHSSDEDRRIYDSSEYSEQDLQFWLDCKRELASERCHVTQLAIPEFAGGTQLAMRWLEQHWNDIKDQSWSQCPKNLQELLSLPSRIKQELEDFFCCWSVFREILTAAENGNPNLGICTLSNGNVLLLPDDVIYIHERLDWARDHHHFDILTATWAVRQILSRMQF